MLLDSRQLRHVRRCFLVTHVDAVPMLLSQDAIHVIGILVTAIICLRSAHLHLVLEDLRHHARLRVTLIAFIENPVVNVHILPVHIRNRHRQTIATAPRHVIYKHDVIRLTVRQHTVVVFQPIRRECQPLLLDAVLHEQALEVRAVDGRLNITDFLGRITVWMLIFEIGLLIFVPHGDGDERISGVVHMSVIHTAQRVIRGPPGAQHNLLHVVTNHTSRQRGRVIRIQLLQTLRRPCLLLVFHQVIGHKEPVGTGTARNGTAHGHQTQRREVTGTAIAHRFILSRNRRFTQSRENLMKRIFRCICQHTPNTVQQHFRHAIGIGDIHIRRFRLLADDIRQQELNNCGFSGARGLGEAQKQRIWVIHELLNPRGNLMLALQHLSARQPESGVRLTVPFHCNHEIVEAVLPRIQIRPSNQVVHFRRFQLHRLGSHPSDVVVHRFPVLHPQQQAERVRQRLLRLWQPFNFFNNLDFHVFTPFFRHFLRDARYSAIKSATRPYIGRVALSALSIFSK